VGGLRVNSAGDLQVSRLGYKICQVTAADEADTLNKEQAVEKGSGWKQAVREFLYGMTRYEIVQHSLEMRASMETLFMLVNMGDMLGVPILPPYYSLRLLPYVVPQIQTWKRRVLRERELSDDHEYDLHGL
jgi:hypothetical protein